MLIPQKGSLVFYLSTFIPILTYSNRERQAEETRRFPLLCGLFASAWFLMQWRGVFPSPMCSFSDMAEGAHRIWVGFDPTGRETSLSHLCGFFDAREGETLLCCVCGLFPNTVGGRNPPCRIHVGFDMMGRETSPFICEGF